MGWQEKPDNKRQSVKHPFCPFNKFCVFLHGEEPESVLAERTYLRKRVDELEFAMDFTNSQVKKFQERIRALEENNSTLETELSEALRAPFNKYPKKEPLENPKKSGAPFGHQGYFRQKPEQIDENIEVCLDKCPLCGSENISPCGHATSHIQEDLDSVKLTNICFIHCYYWCPNCKNIVHG